MQRMLVVECAAQGLLTINGQFCGPLEGEGQTFPMGRNAQAYLYFAPYDEQIRPLAAALEMRNGRLYRLTPQERCFALVWPEGVVQLELRPAGCPESAQSRPAGMQGLLARYLAAQMRGDPAAQRLLARARDGISLAEYEAVVPLRFAAMDAPAAYDERAGLVRRIAPNAAAVDAALASTAAQGQGQRLIERIEILRT